MKKYRKKPVVIEAVVIEAVQLVEGCGEDMAKLISRTIPVRWGHDRKLFMLIPTLEGETKAVEGDWIIPEPVGEPDGEHYCPCKPDIFEQTYELVEE